MRLTVDMSRTLRSYVNEKFAKYEPCKIILITSMALGSLYALVTLGRNPEYTSMRFGQWKRKMIGLIFRCIFALPLAKKKVNQENEKLIKKLASSFKMEGGDSLVCTRIPENGMEMDRILLYMEECSKKEKINWKEGCLSGKVYGGTDEVIDLMSTISNWYCVSNALHPGCFPSIRKFEAETIRMTASMLNGDERVCGTLTSGGTESILMAMKAYYKLAVEVRKIIRPEIVMSDGAHAAFDKASEYFGLKCVRTPILPDGTANINLIRASMNSNTIAIIASATTYAHGSIDNIEEMSDLALKSGVLLHVDACLAGFFLPWAEKLGYPVPAFDFRVPGVTSISCDTHKFGFGPKGESVLLFRDRELRRHMYFVQPDWNGGIYASPTVSGSRPGYPIAGTWAVMVFYGEKGYMKAIEDILEVRRVIIEGTRHISQIQLICEMPSPVLAWKSDQLDMFMLLDAMANRGWVLDALQRPNGFHICLTTRHVERGEKFVKDLVEAVDEVLKYPERFKSGMAPVYGMVSKIPDRAAVKDFIVRYLDSLLDVIDEEEVVTEQHDR